MNNQTTLQKIIYFPLTKMVFGILVVGGSVALTEWAGQAIQSNIEMNDESRNVIVGATESFMALLSYILLFRFYEKRQIKKLSAVAFGKNALIGFAAGLIICYNNSQICMIE